MKNSLVNDPDELQPSGTAPPATSSQMPMLNAMHSQAAARLKQVESANKLLVATRKTLDSLVSKGDAVNNDDVLEAAGNLVVAGADPKQLVLMMAGNPAQGQPPMPEDGPELAAWLSQQDATVSRSEAQMQPALALARHDAIVAALHAITAHHVEQQAKQRASQQSTSSLLQ